VYVDGQRLQKAPLSFPVLNDQQVLRTGRGRVEVLLAPGVFLRLGQQSALRMLDNRLENAVLGVEKGRAAGRNRRVSLRGTVAVSAFRRGNVDALYKWAAVRSFNLFLANRASGSVKQPANWIYTDLGWFWNLDYGAQIAATGSMMKYLPPEREPR